MFGFDGFAYWLSFTDRAPNKRTLARTIILRIEKGDRLMEFLYFISIFDQNVR